MIKEIAQKMLKKASDFGKETQSLYRRGIDGKTFIDKYEVDRRTVPDPIQPVLSG